MTINKWGIYVIIAVAVLGALWFAYTKYQDANENAEDATARRAAGDVAESENPFRAENPLSNVEADPFEKTKKVLNPFE